jgi:NTP pyrophosphatase (non-canonical NTP hydrolase)
MKFISGLDEYQLLAGRTINHDIDPAKITVQQLQMLNFAIGLAGEAGEALEHIKKHVFHGQQLDIYGLSKEMGDVLWYFTALVNVSELMLSNIATENITKLEARYPDGFVTGGGVRDETNA